MTPWQYAKAVAAPTFSMVWCTFWLVYDAVTETGWGRVFMVAVFGALLTLACWQWPRSLESYRRMVASARRLADTMAKLEATMLAHDWPPEVVAMVLADLTPRPRPRRWWPPRPPRL